MFGRQGRALGVDPGLSRCGIGTVDRDARGGRLVRADVVRTGGDTSLGHRLAAIDAALRAAVDEDRPDVLAVERVFLNRQKVTGTGALQVVGLVHLLGATTGLPVVEYTPSQVKAAVTGVGDADKDQVGYMVARMLGLQAVPRPADRADALAVALCHLCQPVWEQGPAGAAAATTSSRTGAHAAGLPPRLAAALAAAGPGLSPATRAAGRDTAPPGSRP
jgi:crossover junction endodeoxyribonuclease RuvC